MEISHNYQGRIMKVGPGEGGASLMLANNKGDYLWRGVVRNISRYQGWFFELDGVPVRVVEEMRIKGAGEVIGVVNKFEAAEIVYKENKEIFSLAGNGVLIYELEKVAEVEIVLDVKEIYANVEFGRHYEIERADGAVIVKYWQEGEKQLEIFMAIGGDFEDIELKQEWIKREYEWDRGRGSAGWEQWVFRLGEARVARIVVAAGKTKKEAVRKVQISNFKFQNNEDVEKVQSSKFKVQNTDDGLRKVQSLRFKVQVEMAGCCAEGALKGLFVENNSRVGLRAGLPWFFQIWQRDEAVSLKALAQIDWKMARRCFWRQICELKKSKFKCGSADAAGWLFLRAGEFIEDKRFDGEEINTIRYCLENHITKLLKNDTYQGLAVNEKGATWMDSLERVGARIEIQALRLRMYDLAARLALTNEQKEYYWLLEARLREEVLGKFFNKGSLADGFDFNMGADFCVRPNVFLAAYIYPELLSQKEWSGCFEYALDRLWLDWGGLATIDKASPLFCERDTGEDPRAYHNGDSWFWVNNLAAVAMARADHKKFFQYILKIFDASTNDILRGGAIGCASEISDAKNYWPRGCFNQAWSDASYLEMEEYIKAIND